MAPRLLALLLSAAIFSSCVTQQSYERANYLVDSLSYELDREKRQRIKMQQYANHLFENYVDRNSRAKGKITAPPQFEDEEPQTSPGTQNVRPVEDIPKEPQSRSVSSQSVPLSEKKDSRDLNEMIAFPNMRVKKIPNGMLVDIPDIEFFKSGSSELTPKAKKYLAEFAKRMAGRENYLIDIEGHTDDSESSKEAGIEDRWDLSAIRATRVLRELVRLGVSPHDVIASGRGEFDPLGSNARRTDKRKNRRIEIRITQKTR